MYHRNITPFFVVFSIVVLLAILLATSLPWGVPEFQISTNPSSDTAAPEMPRSLDPLVTPGPSGR